MVEWFKAAVLKTAEGQLSEGSNPSFSAIFFALISRKKNMKPEKALLHTASAVLHILRQCRKMLHTPTGVLHKNEAFSDEATSL